MIKTLYKRSHLIASGILATLVLGIAAVSASTDAQAGAVQKTDAPMIGRFVVGPDSAVFVPAPPATR